LTGARLRRKSRKRYRERFQYAIVPQGACVNASIRDVAKRAGVSVSTASRALNNKPDVNKDVRKRILSAAEELSYAANVHARVLGGGRSRTLGLIITNSADPFFATLVRGVSDTATSSGYSVIVWNTNEATDLELQAHQRLRERRVDGALLASVQSGDAPLGRLLKEGIPFVLLNRYLEQYPANCVQLDYRSGARAATAHLIALGHRRIAHLTHGDDRYSAQERLAGYREALEGAGLPFAPDLVIPSTSGIEGAYRAVLEALPRLHPRPTALFVYNDIWCVGVLRALHELGLRVPGDISVMGCDDLELSGFLVPPLSTVFQDPYEIGRQGVELLLEQLTSPSDRASTPRRIVLRPELRLRASTAPPGASA
jgi:LacI family transcriptional regulator